MHIVLFVFLLPIAVATISPATLEFQLESGYTSAIDDSQVRLLFESIPSASTLTLKAVPTTVYQPESYEAVEHARYSSRFEDKTIPLRWHEIRLLGPDVTDRHTLAQLARMSANAYQLPGRKNWYDIDDAWSINAVGAPHADRASHLHTVTELSNRLGQRRRRIPRIRLSFSRQLNHRPFDQGHHAAGAHYAKGQTERQPAIFLLLRPRRFHLDVFDRVQLLLMVCAAQTLRRRLSIYCAYTRQPVLFNRNRKWTLQKCVLRLRCQIETRQ